MNVIKKLFVLFLMLPVLAFAGQENNSPIEWLQKMKQAMKTLNYQGTVVFMENDLLDTMKYSHTVEHGLEQERLVSLNSPMREVIRDIDKVTCTFKEIGKRVVDHRPVTHSFLIDLPENISGLADYYQLSFGSHSMIAMRSSREINIKPLDNYRFARKIWIDEDNFLPLQAELLDLSGKVLERFVFTDIQTGVSLPWVDIDKADASIKVHHIHKAQSESFDNLPFSLQMLPPGFEKVFFSSLSMHNSEQAVAHLLLSDGLSNISVYQDEADDSVTDGTQHVGAVNSYTRVIGDKLIVVLGKVPAVTVKSIAEGIKLKK